MRVQKASKLIEQPKAFKFASWSPICDVIEVRVFIIAKKLLYNIFMRFPSRSLNFFHFGLKDFVSQEFSNVRTDENRASFSFACDSRGKFLARYLKVLPSFGRAFTNCIILPSLM